MFFRIKYRGSLSLAEGAWSVGLENRSISLVAGTADGSENGKLDTLLAKEE
jgi:hypothetical protein